MFQSGNNTFLFNYINISGEMWYLSTCEEICRELFPTKGTVNQFLFSKVVCLHLALSTLSWAPHRLAIEYISYSSGVEALWLVVRFIWPLANQFSSFSSISVHASLLPIQPHSHSTLLPPPAVSAVQISPADSCKSQTCQQSPAWLPALTLHKTRPWQAEKAPLCPFFPEQATTHAFPHSLSLLPCFSPMNNKLHRQQWG